jgi:hypothetical protein
MPEVRLGICTPSVLGKYLTDRLHEMESCNNFVPQPMGPHDMIKLLQELEALFQMGVGESATVLKRILDDVVAESSDTKLNFKQIAEAMKTTLLHVNKLMDPDSRRYKE